MPLATLERDLADLVPIIHARRFTLLGGEPLLHPDICGMLDVVRASGISDEVNVTTNGRLLPRMPEDFWKRVQHLFLSVYPNLPESVVELARDHCKKYGVKLEMARWTEFFLQFKPKPDDGMESFKMCQWKSCFTVHDGHFYLCAQSAFFTDRFMSLPQNVDGLALPGLTEQALRDYMNRTTPFVACSICSAQATKVKWFQPKDEQEWMTTSRYSKLPHYRRSLQKERLRRVMNLELAKARQFLETNPALVAPAMFRAWRMNPRQIKWLLRWGCTIWPQVLGGAFTSAYVHRKLREKF